MKPYYETELGKLYHGDCLEVLPGLEPVDLVLTDPLYNVSKAKWDRKEDYPDWLTDIFRHCEEISRENSTLWFFHMVFSDLAEIDRLINIKTNYRHRQLIIIDKGIGSIAGRCNCKQLRTFPRATEYIQFYTFKDYTGAEQLSEKYHKINPMAKYLRNEFKRAGVSNGEIAKLFPSKTGGMTGCVSNWLLGCNFPLKDQYEKMRDYLSGEYLRKEYEDLRKEYEDLRYPFNLPLGVTDVWSDISFAIRNNTGHETPKPTTLVIRIILAATNKGAVVLDPFLGSGTTAIACERLNRKWIGIEIEEKYCEIAAKRIEQERKQLKLF